jgi:hypothetical protein
MAHIDAIGAGFFSDLSVSNFATALPASPNAASFAALFGTEVQPTDLTSATGEFIRIKNIREFPAMGTPPNIVQVPVYGQKTTQQIQGQADAPQMELQINFVPADWDRTTTNLGKMVGDGNQYAFRFALLNTEPTGSGPTQYASTNGAATLGSVKNTVYYWIGKIEAMTVKPDLKDANTATLTISIQSAVYGAYTVAAA